MQQTVIRNKKDKKKNIGPGSHETPICSKQEAIAKYRPTDRQATAQPVIPLAKHSPKFSTCQHPLRGFMESIITESLLGIYYPKACPERYSKLAILYP